MQYSCSIHAVFVNGAHAWGDKYALLCLALGISGMGNNPVSVPGNILFYRNKLQLIIFIMELIEHSLRLLFAAG